MSKQMAARFKLLRILPRAILEELSEDQYPHNLTKTQLVTRAAERWKPDEVSDAFDRLFILALPKENEP